MRFVTLVIAAAAMGTASRASAQVLVVSTERGQGIGRLRGASECTVITAKHVADSFAPARLIGPPGKESTGDVAKSFDGADVAVLRVADASFPCDDWKPPPSVEALLQRAGDGVIRSRSEQGGIEQVHVLITGSDDRWIRVQPRLATQVIRQTLSGSPLYAEGMLLGILLSVKDGTGNVLRIDRVMELVDPWFGEAPGGIASSCGPAVKLDDAGWASLHISGIDYLPPLTDSGDPDFYLVLSDGNTRLAMVRMRIGQDAATEPFRTSLLRRRSLDVSMIEQDPFSEEQVVEGLSLPGSRLAGCQPLALKIRNEIFRKYSNIDRDRKEVRLTVRAVAVEPELASGADQEAASPNVVAPGASRADTVSFDRGDATDHVQIPPVGARAAAILWLTDRKDVQLTALPPAGGRVTRVAEFDSTFRHAELDVVERNDGAPLNVRVLAPGPGAGSPYRVYALGNEDRQQAALEFVGRFLRDDAPNWTTSSMWALEVGQFLGAVRRHFGISAGAMADVIEKDLTSRGVATQLDTATFPRDRDRARVEAVKIALQVLAAERAAYAAVPATATQREIVGQMLAVLQAEQEGKVDDRRSLTAAAHARSTVLSVRAIEAIAKLGDSAYATSVLNDLLLDDRREVAEAARQALRGKRP